MATAKKAGSVIGLGAAVMLGGFALPAGAADAARGAALYMRTDTDVRSCVSCHGPDPGQNPNNILRAADRPEALTRALSTVSAMGFLGSALSDADRADIAAFLGTATRLQAPDAKLRVWPITFDFGLGAVAAPSATQSIRLHNPSPEQAVSIAAIRASGAPMLIEHDCPAAMPPGGRCDVQVRLQPVAGSTRGAVSIQTSAFTAPVIAGIAGRGTDGAVSLLAWQSAENTLRFEASTPAAVTRTLSLLNPGPMPALLGTTTVLGPGASRFKVERGCPAGSVMPAGTTCELVLSFVPSLLPIEEATLQLRSDQSNPASVRLVSATPPAAPSPVEPAAAMDVGGGCSAGPPQRRAMDPLLLAALLAAAAAMLARRRQR